ncbi:MAG: response regulator [Myxococcales bacterium]|nr:response regulator [Myxococcales bacterium]
MAPGSEAGSRPRVLLAEDDINSARTLARMLREDGYDVDLCLDGASAIARLSRGPLPTVLVADYRMPHADGLSVAMYARSRAAPKVLPVVLVTSYVEALGEQSSKGDPNWVLLPKPLSYEALTGVLKRLVGAE